ncbi:MAG: GTP-dependent dephospho-CoA kinase family protein [Candidatus Altiarchaeota archaeon]|nr:GTP-dependent dephospho-CoA kinase family protein [Candidatus Altiarchaeota archaeon]
MIRIDKNLTLPESLRRELKRPFGTIFKEVGLLRHLRSQPGNRVLVSVGDQISSTLLSSGVTPNVIIWDKKIKRARAQEETTTVLESFLGKRKNIKNPAGMISKEAWEAVTDSLSGEPTSILVDGEEDLLAIPAVLNSRDGTMVVYGSPDRGAILIDVNRKIKAELQGLLASFTTKDENRVD